jgi:hypothetical protein
LRVGEGGRKCNQGGKNGGDGLHRLSSGRHSS